MIDTLSIAEKLREAGFDENEAILLTRAIEKYATDQISLVEDRMNTELARSREDLANAFKRSDEQFKRSDERFAELTRLSDAKFETGQANMKAEIEKAVRSQTVWIVATMTALVLLVITLCGLLVTYNILHK